MTTTIVTMVGLQCRLEYDALQMNDFQGGCFAWWFHVYKQGNLQQELLGFSINVARTTVLFGLSLMVIAFLQTFGGADNTRIHSLTFATILTVVIPSVFIFKHSSIKMVAKNVLKQLTT